MLTRSDFEPAFWLRNPHAQTIFASKFRPLPALQIEHERLELEDGDFLDMSWLPGRDIEADAPLVIVLHGLNGSLESKYARGLLRQVAAHGARGVLMHFRGAAQPNRLARSYHSGETGDFAEVVLRLQKRYPNAAMAAVGYSLGGNVLLKYLGEQGSASPLRCAVAVSVPYNLRLCAYAVKHGFSRIYQSYMINGMQQVVKAKIERGDFPLPVTDLSQLSDFPSFDDAITAPLNGFANAHDYYRRASCKPFLKSIRTPTLALHARDDPFMAPAVVPQEADLSPAIRLELSECGGHVGFISGGRFGEPVYWLERRIPDYLRARLPGFAREAADEAVHGTS